MSSLSSTEARPSSPAAAWRTTKAGKRVLELKEVDESIASLLHLAGCTLASLHPLPLASFTDKVVSFDSDDDEGAAGQGDDTNKAKQFGQYTETYYAALNDIQLALRASIRHLRLSRASPAPILDPFFGSLATPGGGGVAVGGVDMGESLRPFELPSGSVEPGSAEGVKGAAEREDELKMSVRALELEREAWEALEHALRLTASIPAPSEEKEAA